MLVRTFTYTDYDNVERTENAYFNLTRSEIAEMELSIDGGLARYLTKIAEAKDGKLIMEKFKWLILKSYGVKSDDGRRLMKNEELSKAFEETEMYNQLFMELITDAKAAAKFIEQVIPATDGDKPNVNVVSAPQNN